MRKRDTQNKNKDTQNYKETNYKEVQKRDTNNYKDEAILTTQPMSALNSISISAVQP